MSVEKIINQIEKDTDRDFYLGAEEAVKYGLVDEVIAAPATKGKTEKKSK